MTLTIRAASAARMPGISSAVRAQCPRWFTPSCKFVAIGGALFGCGQDAGVVDEDVDLRVRGEDRRRCCLDGGLRSEVELDDFERRASECAVRISSCAAAAFTWSRAAMTT